MSDRRRLVKRVLVAALVAFLLWLPQYAEGFWLQTGLFAMSAAIGAIGGAIAVLLWAWWRGFFDDLD